MQLKFYQPYQYGEDRPGSLDVQTIGLTEIVKK